VTDVTSGNWVESAGAHYVHGSNALGPMRDGNLPAFTEREAAERFAAERGGVVLSADQITPKFSAHSRIRYITTTERQHQPNGTVMPRHTVHRNAAGGMTCIIPPAAQPIRCDYCDCPTMKSTAALTSSSDRLLAPPRGGIMPFLPVNPSSECWYSTSMP
jgi:hypothetical protein